MISKENKVFLILEVLKDKTKAPTKAFIIKDRETAKIYAKNWLRENEKWGIFELREIGKIEKNQFKEYSIFISNIFVSTNELEIRKAAAKRDKELIEQAKLEKEVYDQIQILFQTKRI